MSAEFLKAYRGTAQTLLPTDPAVTAALLDMLRLDKALFELSYELNYRPDWVWLPLQGLLHLVRSGD
jgi:maltose alpha-D-glucosyltransferase/alpha-amylase